MSNPTPLLNVRNLSVGYQRPLLKKLSFQIYEGEVFFLKGLNGVGKSSLIKTLLGDIPPLSGDVQWFIPKKNQAFLPQLTNKNLPLSITLREILESFLIDEKVKSVFSYELQNKRWIDASGGEKQKTLILTRLQGHIDFLIMDEPFNHIDQKSIYEITHFLFSLIDRKMLKGIIFAGHTHLKQDAFTKRMQEFYLS